MAALGILALIVGIAQSSLVQSKSGTVVGTGGGKSANVPAVQQNTLVCEQVAELPSFAPKSYCAPLKKGVPTKIIETPRGVPIVIAVSPAKSAKIEYFDRNNKYLETRDGVTPAPQFFRKFRITLPEDGDVLLKVGS